MIWKFDFSQRTLIWLLVIVFVTGAGVCAVQALRGHRIIYPLTVVRDDSEGRALHRMADSIMNARRVSRDALININTATGAQFESLDGIGKVLAARIVAYRDENGRFLSVDELDNVSGIGPKRLAAIRARCTVDSL